MNKYVLLFAMLYCGLYGSLQAAIIVTILFPSEKVMITDIKNSEHRDFLEAQLGVLNLLAGKRLTIWQALDLYEKWASIKEIRWKGYHKWRNIIFRFLLRNEHASVREKLERILDSTGNLD